MVVTFKQTIGCISKNAFFYVSVGFWGIPLILPGIEAWQRVSEAKYSLS